jgi:hypothetical protein
MARNREYSFEIVDQCEGLYVQEDKTQDEISKGKGVSIAQVQRWHKKYEWKKKREEYRQRVMKAQEETRAIVREEVLLQDLVNQKVMMDDYFKGRVYDKGDSNTVGNYINIINNISKLLADMRKRDETLHGLQKVDRPQLFLDFMRDIVSFLKEHDPVALSALEKNFDEFINFAKEKYAKS